MGIDTFRQLADYNHWANRRLYAAALELPEELYRRPVGVFFKSLHGTLNHILVADRIWLKRLTGEGAPPDRLDTILYDARDDLLRARMAEDARLKAVVAAKSEADLAGELSYQTTSGKPYRQKLADILLHVFNHQTHHRGQAHACCSILTGAEPPALDLMHFQRGAAAPEL
jgi:uncharacterized damage-inducible protein DinB